MGLSDSLLWLASEPPGLLPARVITPFFRGAAYLFRLTQQWTRA